MVTLIWSPVLHYLEGPCPEKLYLLAMSKKTHEVPPCFTDDDLEMHFCLTQWTEIGVTYEF